MHEFELHNTIKIQRAIKNVTQEGLAQEVGVTRKTINAIENRKIVPSTLLAMRLATFFEVAVEDVFSIKKV
jgi:putative transcriptional regulator